MLEQRLQLSTLKKISHSFHTHFNRWVQAQTTPNERLHHILHKDKLLSIIRHIDLSIKSDFEINDKCKQPPFETQKLPQMSTSITNPRAPYNFVVYRCGPEEFAVFTDPGRCGVTAVKDCKDITFQEVQDVFCTGLLHGWARCPQHLLPSK